MLKHLPEGLVPFEDCGFARHPFAPLAMEPGAKGRAVWLPAGTWRDFFTGETLSGGRERCAECPLERIPVYERMRTDG